jgi:sugar phosphate isomerase/epimerase
LKTAAVTDGFCPELELSTAAMADLDICGAELRVVFGKNILDLTDGEVDAALAILNGKGLDVVAIASPLLKCVLPDAPPLDETFEQQVYAARYAFEDQERLADRAFEVARRTSARIVRVFSYWRTVSPAQCRDRIAAALHALAERAAREDVTIAVENVPACNVSTGAELAHLLATVNHPNLKAVWDPANAYISGELAFPDGYRAIPAAWIVHVHAADCYLDGPAPVWGPFGVCGVDWKGQIAALAADGYDGWISLENRWMGPREDKLQGGTISGCNLQAMVAAREP